MAEEKDKTYYAKVVERAFTEMYKDEDDVYVNMVVDTKDERCFQAALGTGLPPWQMMFFCRKTHDEITIKFHRDGKDRIAQALGLVDTYSRIERIDVQYVRKEDGYLHYDIPKEVLEYGYADNKVKLYGLESFVDECNYNGWGDGSTSNTLEIIADLMKQDFIDREKKEIMWDLNAYVGPADEDTQDYYAEFEFSHIELARYEEGGFVWAVYYCYNYRGLQEYENGYGGND